MAKIILTVGPSACGKTTWATEEVKRSQGKIVNLNRDDIRRSMFMFKGWNEYRFTGQREKMVTETQFAMAKSALEKGISVIVSDTNLNPAYRTTWEQFAKEMNVQFELKVFSVDIRELNQRNWNREASVDPKVLKQQYRSFMEQFGGLRTYQPNENLQKAVIFDLDGTLATMNDRSPFDWSRVGEDSPNEYVIDLLRMIRLAHPDWVIITLSGRDGVCEEITKQWLVDNNAKSDYHFQRKQGDQRRDSIIKEEIFWNDIEPKFNVLYVVDDRQQVVDMWDMIGVQVWQVAQNDI